MEKTYSLSPTEANQLNQMEQEKTRVLAMIGAFSLDMEQAKKNLEIVVERQKSLVNLLVQARGIERFEGASARNGTLTVQMPDPAPIPITPHEAPKTNGLPAEQ